MSELQLLIPIADNAGVAFDRLFDEQYELALANLFGGYTNPTVPVGGGWRDSDGTLYRDQNRSYIVFVSGIVQMSPQIIAAVQYAKWLYNQLAITVRYLDHAEIL
ncbi:MAG: hypothetical protein L0241_18520 [Planctomycetia bacterium]|nr:hypothetical protein [Planctomycetia bacterium]